MRSLYQLANMLCYTTYRESEAIQQILFLAKANLKRKYNMIFENRPLKHVLLHKTCRTGGKSILIGSIKITDYPTCTEIHTSSYT